NQTSQNIGARRLYTLLERLLEDVSYSAPDAAKKTITIDAEYVRDKLEAITANEDLTKFIL
ncbi:MAG TPA: HslU--HslV peptidase ATPase subunit, partial [Planctomycetaceae bacterium]|nr:HslU--HslV peptidase ATPase subunit [Planctomycetaceae bacterium]